jgi:uncharacterized membrane protein YkvA (DUF1232 family)
MDNKNLIKKILESAFYSNSYKKATRMSGNASSILNLLKNVFTKIKGMGPGILAEEIKKKILTLGSLSKNYAIGTYRDVELKNILIILAALLYFLSPIDLVPDFLPFVGFADDVALLSFVFNTIKQEIEKFELWELNKNLNK